VWQNNDILKRRSKVIIARSLIVTSSVEIVRRWDINHRVTGRTWQMSLIMQQRKQSNFYTGHRIQETPIDIGQLCVFYAIVSLLAQKPFTNLPRRYWCTQWKTWCQKLRRVLPNHTKSWGEETIPSPRSTRYVTLTSIKEISRWLRHKFCLLHQNATTHGIQEKSSLICHCKWIHNRMFSTSGKVF